MSRSPGRAGFIIHGQPVGIVLPGKGGRDVDYGAFVRKHDARSPVVGAGKFHGDFLLREVVLFQFETV